jgi:hypothetical protein
MENNRLFWVLCLTLLLVVGLNILIYVALKGKKTESMVEVLRRLSKGVRNPWEAEDAALSELSKLVADLKSENNVERNAEK